MAAPPNTENNVGTRAPALAHQSSTSSLVSAKSGASTLQGSNAGDTDGTLLSEKVPQIFHRSTSERGPTCTSTLAQESQKSINTTPYPTNLQTDVLGCNYSTTTRDGIVKKEVHYILPNLAPAEDGGRNWIAVRTIYFDEYKDSLKRHEGRILGIWKRKGAFRPILNDVCVKHPTYWQRTKTARNSRGELIWKVDIYFRNMQTLIEEQVVRYTPCPPVIPANPEHLWPSHRVAEASNQIGKSKSGKHEIVCERDGAAYWTVWWEQTYRSNSPKGCYRLVRREPLRDDYNYFHRQGDWYKAKIPYIKELPEFPVEKLLDGVDQALCF
ncbi:hypothetical protein MKZ38_000535 [Zalerion maritima]|uniref:Uncharacterized protein n=1 Tax=Zalerion maritima TaxID=339359 RepID=A0AAD5RRE3_9PEZI|nr:hypothetical protein MKZ38_000535 [Zalerion maritima]